MTQAADFAREEFFSEAQELVELLSRSLLGLDELSATGGEDPALVNEAFRAVHTLKSLAGIFNQRVLGNLAHRLEDILDELRLGRIALTRELIDALFQAVELCWQLLNQAEKAPEGSSGVADSERLERLNSVLSRFTSQQASKADEIQLDPSLLAVLTEYEEHRLRSCIAQGLALHKVRVTFALATIDRELEAVKAKAKPLGEVITYLPTGSGASLDSIELEILLATGVPHEALALALEVANSQVECIFSAQSGKGKATSEPSQAALSPASNVEIQSAVLTVAPTSQGSAGPMLAPFRSVSQSVRVDIRKLDALMNAVGELSVIKSTFARIGVQAREAGQRALASELQRAYRGFERRLSELQGGILEVRMVPLSQVFERLGRVVRQVSRELDKEIRLVVTGGDTELDKLIVEELSDPLMHIVRNAIDHGIESRQERALIGKPASGTVAINAFQKGNHVVVEVEDDGAGVNERSLLSRAVELHKISSEEAGNLTRAEALGLIFLPGLSTRQAAGDVSGRGVGMDVVKTNISRLGGLIDVRSERGIGTKISLTLPITLAIVSALLVRVAARTYAVPLNAVSEALLLDPAMLRRVDGREVMMLRGTTVPLCRLQELFALSDHGSATRGRYAVVASVGARRLGLVVDELLGQQDVVIKPLGASLSRVRGFSGATELGEHHVVLVLDVSAIVEEMLSGSDNRERTVEHA